MAKGGVYSEFLCPFLKFVTHNVMVLENGAFGRYLGDRVKAHEWD